MEEFRNPAVDQAVSGAHKLSAWIHINKSSGGLLGIKLKLHRSIVSVIFSGEPLAKRVDTQIYAKFYARTGISEFDPRNLANFVHKPRGINRLLRL